MIAFRYNLRLYYILQFYIEKSIPDDIREAGRKCVEAFAKGKTSKSGKDYRTTWIELTHAGQEQIDKFNHDVDNYLAI